MPIQIVSSTSVSNTTRELKALERDLEIEDGEVLIRNGKVVANADADAFDDFNLGTHDLLLDGESLDDDELAETDVDVSLEQEVLSTMLDNYLILVPSPSDEQLRSLAHALGMEEEEKDSFVQLARAVLEETQTVTAGAEDDEGGDDDFDADENVDVAADADVEPAADVTPAVEALESDDLDFSLDAGDLSALKIDRDLPPAAEAVTATPESLEFKKDLVDDGNPSPTDDTVSQDLLRNDGEPVADQNKQIDELRDDGDDTPDESV